MAHALWTVRRSDPDYPPLLAETADPPSQLYGLGNRKLLTSTRMIALVGTRKASTYGKQVVRDIVPMLVQSGLVTVSGLAFGIDAAVHQETVEAGGATIAVLGSPAHIEEVHPRGQQWLAHKIVDSGGLLLSEYPPGHPVQKHHFPERNRIIAGLCRATVVVEAPKKSGALITARFALEENRTVYAVPGSIYSQNSAGCNHLIGQGATPLLSCQQFRDALELEGDFLLEDHDIIHRSDFSPEEQQLVQLIQQSPRTLDALIEQSTLPAPTVIALVTELTLLSVLKKVGGDHYSL